MLIVDRISDGTAVIEDGERRFEVPEETLAKDVKEGDSVFLDNGVYRKDIETTEKRRKEILKLQNSLWE
ncbi:MAG: DUF3006 domain-containing protein [Oscillospiraceae bacterium]|jgi:pyruvate kinase|nr:DUF3006 domain-containing protein [Oscillospiraceae bacterium]